MNPTSVIPRCEHRGGQGAQVPDYGRVLQGGDGQQLGQEEEHGNREGPAVRRGDARSLTSLLCLICLYNVYCSLSMLRLR